MRFVCLFVTTLPCKVPMLLSGDLDAPLTVLCRSGRLLTACTAEAAASRKLGWGYTLSNGRLCSGEWEHGPQTPRPPDVTNQSLR